MADEADQAHELEQLALRHALAHRKGGANLPPKGTCYNCDEPLKPIQVGGEVRHVQLFCDSSCAQDWEKVQAAKSRR
jgi:hypothetical protein